MDEPNVVMSCQESDLDDGMTLYRITLLTPDETVAATLQEAIRELLMVSSAEPAQLETAGEKVPRDLDS